MTTSPAPGVAAPAPAPMVPSWYRVASVHRETHDTATLAVSPVDAALPAPHPGQFHMVAAVGVGEVPVSVSAVGPGDGLCFTVRDVGAVTGALASLPAGAVVGLRGPFGTSWDLGSAEGGDVVVVAGGLGLAPLRQAVREVLSGRDRYGEVVLVLGARTPGDLCFGDEIQAWRSRDDVHVAVTVDVADRSWWGSVGVVTSQLPHPAVDPARATALVCGPEVMMRATARELVARGMPAGRVRVSLERNMRCAVGHCGHCQLGPHLVCRDGAVLDWPRVAGLVSVREL